MAIMTILFLADTHLGFDMTQRPRVERRRRGQDFFENFERALEPALNKEVDCVIHGGDLLYRSKVPAGLVAKAFDPLIEIASSGIPVYIVPGNHERSMIPYKFFTLNNNIHIFDFPKTFNLTNNKGSLKISGFPYVRGTIRKDFPKVLEQTGWSDQQGDAHILCFHQCVEGATVGPVNYTFKYNDNVLRSADIPKGFAAILSGHIHRFQVLEKDLKGRRIAAPIFYPGSTERTSLAERNEAKGYLILDIEIGENKLGILKNWKFIKLLTRPMVVIEKNINGMTDKGFRIWLKDKVDSLPGDSIVKLKVKGTVSENLLKILRVSFLRTITPLTMNIEVVIIE